MPKKQCYCKLGFYGTGCNKKSPYKTMDINFGEYKHKELSPDMQLYYRVLDEQKELEVVLVANSTSWVALGWRPRKLTPACKNFPLIGSDATEESLTALPEPSGEKKGSSEPEPASKILPEPSTKSSSEPEPEHSDAIASKTSPEPSPKSSSEPKPEHSNPIASKTLPEPSPKSNSEPEPGPIASKTKRVAEDTRGVDKVATSVSYKVSAVQGRRKRDAEGMLCFMKN